MAKTQRIGRDDLRGIAHEAMHVCGLLPEFSAAVIAETNRITRAATASGEVRDLRDLRWASIARFHRLCSGARAIMTTSDAGYRPGAWSRMMASAQIQMRNR